MKLNGIQISNFLGAIAVEAALSKPVMLFAGKNYAGKSSVKEAVIMALTGEPVRVNLKKDYPALLSDDAKSGFASVTTEAGEFSIVLPSGKGKHSDVAALPYVLDAQRFSQLDTKQRRSFLFGLMGVKMDGAAVKKRLLEKGCVEAKVDQIAPILRAGFDAAASDAASKARDAKAGWKTATGGETWGSEKAAKWVPPVLEFDADQAEKLLVKVRTTIAADEADIGGLQNDIGAARADVARRQSAEARRLELKATAEQVDRIKSKLERDQAELTTWEKKVADCKALAGVATPDPKAPGEFLLRGLANVADEFLTLSTEYHEIDWPGDLINRAAAHLAEYKKLHGWPLSTKDQPDPDAVAELPRYEKALSLMQSAVANGKRDLDAANAAQVEYNKVVAEQGAAIPDIEGMQAKLREITTRRDNFRADERKYSDMAREATGRAALVAQVAKLHTDVMEWTAIADALAPDGIPAELLAEALEPINDRLTVSAESAQWARIEITADMQINSGLHERPYALMSESEKWRVDAMIAEAVSFLSGVRLLVLDRFDVLDLQGREDALYWLDDLAQANDIDSALLFGTLKSLPSQLPSNIEAIWIENGVAGEMKEAA